MEAMIGVLAVLICLIIVVFLFAQGSTIGEVRRKILEQDERLKTIEAKLAGKIIRP